MLPVFLAMGFSCQRSLNHFEIIGFKKLIAKNVPANSMIAKKFSVLVAIFTTIWNYMLNEPSRTLDMIKKAL